MLEITPRNYQQNSVDKIIDAYERNVSRQLLVFATGLGKTFATCILRHQFKPHKKTLFLVDRIELAYQALKAFQTADPTLSVGVEMNDHTHSKSDDVVVSSIPTIGRKGSHRIEKFNPDDYGLVIVDEAHKSITETWSRSLNYMQVGPDNYDDEKLLLGVTATPNRPDGKPLKYLYDDITENLDIRWALQNGWLSDFEFIREKTKTDISGVNKNCGKFNQKQLDKAVNNEDRNAQIFKSYKKYSDGELALAYGSSVDHSKLMARLFTKNGVESRCIHAETPKHKRKKWLKMYRQREIKVIWNHSTMTYGVDLPNASTSILGRPIGSNLLYQQIIGRVLRPADDSLVDEMDTAEERRIAMELSSKPRAKIIDFHDVTKDKNVCTPATLFGFHPDLEPKEGQKFYKDVVEQLDEVEHEEQIDVSEITDLDDIELHVEREKADLSNVLEIPNEIQMHSNKSWVEVGEDHYEISYTEDQKVMIANKNQLDMWDLKVYDVDSKSTQTLNTFGSLSGAINTGDKYAEEKFDTSYSEGFSTEEEGVTASQFKYLKQFLKYDDAFKVNDDDHRYDDTGIKVCHYAGDTLDRGKASQLLNRLFTQK